LWLVSIIIRISNRFISWHFNIRSDGRYTKDPILITWLSYIPISEPSGLTKVIINSDLFFSWLSRNTLIRIPFIFNFRSESKYVSFFYMLCSGLCDIFNNSNWFLFEISIVLHILLNNPSSWELVHCEVRLDTVFSSVLRDMDFLTKDMFFGIEFPVIITVFLLSTLVVSVCFYI